MVTPPQTAAALEALAEVATAPRHKRTLPAPRRPPPHAPGAKAAREERAPKRRCHGAADPSRREFGALSDRERFPLGGGGFPAMELRPDDAYRGAAGDKLRQGRECRDWLERTRAQRYLARLLLTNGEARPAAERLPGEEPVWPLLTADSLRVRTLEARGRSSWSECSGYKKQAEQRKQLREAERAEREAVGALLRNKFVSDADLLLIVEASLREQPDAAAAIKPAQLLPVVVRVLRDRGEADAQADKRGRCDGRNLIPQSTLRKVRELREARLGEYVVL